MNQVATIRLVEGSIQSEIDLHQVMEHLERYRKMSAYTGQQLDWDYAAAAFPYQIEEKSKDGRSWLVLTGTNPNLYKYLVIGVVEPDQVQIILPADSTHGDKAKANELSRYLARSLKAELHLFNGRVMYFNPRK
ncbi:hypothetical protein JIR001_20930 [Polycladomyces abyssicola]|uniref:DUF1885 family protein n=1 Tax=Polycladomyces abyssicola TaxID=1125966 RepID=A0A8D5UFM9_9BACL|nr:DUF1885 family protein [Polycladomyces abyssicola]BCU82310.1 hypothetical protein JIR001_20930 [Polycladomyces abyssicola]